MPRPSVQVDTSGLNDILRRLDDNRDAIVRRVAFEVEAEAKLIPPPIDTGALKASIYTLTSKSDGFAAARQQAMGLAGADGKQLSESDFVELPRVEEGVAHVGPSVHYAIYHELGTSDIAARPYLVPAADIVRARLHQFMDDLQNLAEGGRVGD